MGAGYFTQVEEIPFIQREMKSFQKNKRPWIEVKMEVRSPKRAATKNKITAAAGIHLHEQEVT